MAHHKQNFYRGVETAVCQQARGAGTSHWRARVHYPKKRARRRQCVRGRRNQKKTSSVLVMRIAPTDLRFLRKQTLSGTLPKVQTFQRATLFVNSEEGSQRHM